MPRLALFAALLPSALLLAMPITPALGRDEAIATAAPRTAPSSTLSSASTIATPKIAPAYPATRRQDLVETKFGVPVADPYRWLENDVRADTQVADWVAAENRTTNTYLASLPGRDILRQRMEALTDYERYGLPRKAGGRYFYTRNTGLQNQSPLWVREGLDGPARLLLDPNTLSPDAATALAEWRPSPDGRYLLYALQDAGSDWRTLRVMDVATGAVLSDSVQWVKFATLAWRQDGLGFFYSRFDAPASEARAQAALVNHRVYYHQLGTAQAADRLIYATPNRPQLLHRAQVTDDGRWLVISSSQGTDARYELTLVALDTPDARPRTLVAGPRQDWALIGSQGDKLYFRTDHGAPRGRIVVLDAAHRHPMAELIPQRRATLVGGAMVGNRMIVAYLANGRTAAELIDLDGHVAGDVPLPGIGTAAGFAGRSGDPETFFRFSGFTTPNTVYRFNVATGETSIFAQPHLDFDPASFTTEQVFFASKDGTQIPMFLVRRKDVVASGRPAPTLLYGYGGFNITMNPAFSPTELAWVEQGGVLAIANVRGGGEYGKSWHDAGRLSNKQNVFDDFIAAGEYLKSSGTTGPDQLAIEGRSNGGLLVGAVVNQRPDLFAAALPAVGVMDMLRFDQFTAGRYWVDDYGHPDREADFRNLLAYSPYHNVRAKADYPAILVTTADTDDRVVPGHSFKYAAALQHAALGERPHLIRIETRAGHGSGKPVDKQIEEAADMYSFAAYWTGLKVEAK